MSTMGSELIVCTRIAGVWLAGSVALTMVTGTASASPLTRPTPLASQAVQSNAVPRQAWNPTPEIITSEYEYHQPTNQSRNQQYGGQVALSGDGETLAVADVWYFGGSEWPWYGSGAVYVYRRESNGWQ